MKKSLLIPMVGLVAVVAASGCRRRVMVVAQPPGQQVMVQAQPQPQPAGVGVDVRISAQGAGITVVDSYCNAGQPEVCNGLDDNCNGVIDEGCGFSGGNIQITLAWQTGADLDLYVTDPTGYTISYQNRRSPSGGHLDQDARGACARSRGGATIENVYWESPRPPPGTYQVEVHYWGNCRVAGTTQATLSVAVGGQVIGAYNVVLRPSERQAVAVFNMP